VKALISKFFVLNRNMTKSGNYNWWFFSCYMQSI